MTDGEPPFWKRKSLAEMNRQEWESLCDCCGKCCVFKAQDPASNQLVYLNVACGLLDSHSCQCTDYQNRIPSCWTMTADLLPHMSFMPATCAYRLIHEGRELPQWHPLLTGDPETVHDAGISVRGIKTEKEVQDPKLFAKQQLENPRVRNLVEPMMKVNGTDLQDHDKTNRIPDYWKRELEPAE